MMMIDELKPLEDTLTADNVRYLDRIKELTEICNQFYAQRNEAVEGCRMALEFHNRLPWEHQYPPLEEFLTAVIAKASVRGDKPCQLS